MNVEGITIRKGGSIGIAVFPEEWNKTQVLEFLQQYNTIYYVGDSYSPDGNDHELIYHPLVKGIKVNNPADTLTFLYGLV
jgi:phosphomannomutase